MVGDNPSEVKVSMPSTNGAFDGLLGSFSGCVSFACDSGCVAKGLEVNKEETTSRVEFCCCCSRLCFLSEGRVALVSSLLYPFSLRFLVGLGSGKSSCPTFLTGT